MQESIQIDLHLFQRNHLEKHGIDDLNLNTTYYKSKTGHKGFSLMAPFSISSYFDEPLISKLNKDNDPIIFHGIETTLNLKEIVQHDRKIVIRIGFQESSNDFSIKKFITNKGDVRWHDFFTIRKSAYQMDLISHYPILVTTKDAADVLNYKADKINNIHIPQFIGIPSPMGEEGTGNFCLFHGNLDKHENEQAAYWLLNNVFNEIDIPLVIAGYNPSKLLEKAAHRQLNTCLVANPSSIEIIELIKKAQMIIFPSLSNDGYTHELIHSLVFGRHILSIQEKNTTGSLDYVIHSENGKDEFAKTTKNLFGSSFTEKEKNKREAFLNENLNDRKSAEKLIEMLY